MSYDDADHVSDDEDWYDDENELEDELSARCPECGGQVHVVSVKCPSCGYWLSADDRRVMWSGMRKPLWLRATAWIILAAFVVSLLAIGAVVF